MFYFLEDHASERLKSLTGSDVSCEVIPRTLCGTMVPFVFLVLNVPPCFCALRVSVKSVDVLFYVCSHRDIRHTKSIY